MKNSMLILAIVILPTMSHGQGESGVSISGGIADGSPVVLSASYFHNVVMKQLHIEGGFRYYNAGKSVTDDFDNLSFSGVNQTFVGLRLGDYLFAAPRVTYNWYGRHKSMGWGFAGGLLIHPSNYISFGFSVGYDQTRFDSALDSFASTRFTSVAAILNLNILH